jgi:ligand-binding SRPBCC domain-containing protein
MSTNTPCATCKDRFTCNLAQRNSCYSLMSRIQRSPSQHTLMRTYQLQASVWLPQPREQIFGFFSEPKNLERITPPWLRFEILSPAEFAVDRGTRIDYRLRVRSMPLRWQSEIIVWEPPTRFVDQQTRGPYRVWIHEHTFSEHQGGTIAGDNVVYAVPGGKLVQKLFVAPDLDRIFHYRHEILQSIFNPAGLQPSATEIRY